MFQIGNIMIYLTFPSMRGGGGGGGGGHALPHRGTEIPNMTLEWARPIQIHSLIQTEFPVIISARLVNFKRWFELILYFMIPSLPTLPESVL